MHMIDTLICIVYIFVGAKWVLKKVEIEMISAPTNWKIIVLKFLIWLVVPLEIFIYIHFYDSGMVRIFLGVSVLLLYLIETRLLFNEMSKAIVESNIDNREKDVKHILEKRKFRIQLGIICFVSTALGAVAGSLTGDRNTGAYTAQMGTRWNYLGFELPEFGELLVKDLKNPDGTPITEEQAKQIQDNIIKNGSKWDPDGAASDNQLEMGNHYTLTGTALSLKNKYASDSVDQLMDDYKRMVIDKQNNIKETRIYELRPMKVSSVKEHGFDAYLIQGGVGKLEGGYLYDFKTGKSYYSFGGNASKGILPVGAEVAGLRFVSTDLGYDLSRSENREKLLTGRSIGGSIYIGIGGGISMPLSEKFGKVWVYKYGIGLPQFGFAADYTFSLDNEEVEK